MGELLLKARRTAEREIEANRGKLAQLADRLLEEETLQAGSIREILLGAGNGAR